MPTKPVFRIISGGQTGVDRAALDWAIGNRVAHGGWCPAGRRAEDGRIARRYKLRQTISSGYAQRTRWNVRDADATLIISASRHLAGGSELTRRAAAKLGKPLLHLWPRGRDPALQLRAFLQRHRVRTLNIAGPRASDEPGLAQFVTRLLDETFQGNLVVIGATSVISLKPARCRKSKRSTTTAPWRPPTPLRTYRFCNR